MWVKKIVEDPNTDVLEKIAELTRLSDALNDPYPRDVARSLSPVPRFTKAEGEVIQKASQLLEVHKQNELTLRKSYGVNWFPAFDARLTIQKAEDGFRYLSGYISDGSIDRDGDRMSDAALKRMEDTVNSGRLGLFVDHEHGAKNLIGVFTRARRDSKGLWAEARLENEEKNSDVASILSKFQTGIPLGLSIGGDMEGFDNTKERDPATGKIHNVRSIRGVKLYEVSVVGLPANANAYVTNIR